jgi:hypothetical protein
VNNASFFSLIFQLVAGVLPLVFFFQKRKKFNVEFIIFLIVSFIATLIIFITSILKITNAIIFDGFQISSIFLLSIFYFRNIEFKLFSIIVICLGVIEFVFYMLELIILGYPEKSLIIENVGTICCSILLFISLLKNKYSPKNRTISIINYSIFMYKVTSFLLFYYCMILMVKDIWYVHNFIEGSSKLLIAYALWKLPKTAHS